MGRISKLAMSSALIAVLMLLSACGKDKVVDSKPKIAPPAVKTAGVLVAGVDLSTPPFAGVDEGERAGIDIDVASALAGALGVEVKFVDVKPSEAATALAQGKVDMVMSVPLVSADLSKMSSAGTYLHDGPAFFRHGDATASVEPTLTLDTVKSEKFVAQKESESFWILQQDFGPQMVRGTESLRDAMELVERDELDTLAGDAIVGSYMAQDFDGMVLVGQLADAQPLAIVVAPDNVALGDAIRGSLDEMAAGGVIEAILRKWVPGMPQLRIAETTATAQ